MYIEKPCPQCDAQAGTITDGLVRETLVCFSCRYTHDIKRKQTPRGDSYKVTRRHVVYNYGEVIYIDRGGAHLMTHRLRAPLPEEHIPAIIATFDRPELDKKECKLRIWDTARKKMIQVFPKTKSEK